VVVGVGSGGVRVTRALVVAWVVVAVVASLLVAVAPVVGPVPSATAAADPGRVG
jgi:hypothetical protein